METTIDSPTDARDCVVRRDGSGRVVAETADGTLAAEGDAATVIGSAIDAMADRGGGRVSIAPGRYEITAPVSLRDRVAVLGSGPGRTVLAGTPALDDHLVDAPVAERQGSILSTRDHVADVSIEGIEFDGSEMNAPGPFSGASVFSHPCHDRTYS